MVTGPRVWVPRPPPLLRWMPERPHSDPWPGCPLSARWAKRSCKKKEVVRMQSIRNSLKAQVRVSQLRRMMGRHPLALCLCAPVTWMGGGDSSLASVRPQTCTSTAEGRGPRPPSCMPIRRTGRGVQNARHRREGREANGAEQHGWPHGTREWHPDTPARARLDSIGIQFRTGASAVGGRGWGGVTRRGHEGDLEGPHPFLSGC